MKKKKEGKQTKGWDLKTWGLPILIFEWGLSFAMFASEFWLFQFNSLNSIEDIYYKMSLWSCFQKSKGHKERKNCWPFLSPLFMLSLMWSVLWFLDIVSP